MSREPSNRIPLGIDPHVPVNLQRVIRQLEAQVGGNQAAVQGAQSALKQLPDVQSLAKQMRKEFEAGGVAPISISGLNGQAAQPQKATVVSYSVLPGSGSVTGSLAVRNGQLYFYNGSAWVQISSGTAIALSTNGVAGSQVKLNLVAGGNIILSDDGVGDVTISGTGLGVEVNGTDAAFDYLTVNVNGSLAANAVQINVNGVMAARST